MNKQFRVFFINGDSLLVDEEFMGRFKSAEGTNSIIPFWQSGKIVAVINISNITKIEEERRGIGQVVNPPRAEDIKNKAKAEKEKKISSVDNILAKHE